MPRRHPTAARPVHFRAAGAVNAGVSERRGSIEVRGADRTRNESPADRLRVAPHPTRRSVTFVTCSGACSLVRWTMPRIPIGHQRWGCHPGAEGIERCRTYVSRIPTATSRGVAPTGPPPCRLAASGAERSRLTGMSPDRDSGDRIVRPVGPLALLSSVCCHAPQRGAGRTHYSTRRLQWHPIRK